MVLSPRDHDARREDGLDAARGLLVALPVSMALVGAVVLALATLG